MAKDPAFLFYYQEFQHGTRKMTFEEKGAYIELLCEQADCGHLSLDEIKRVLNSHFPIWGAICCKYVVDQEGKFYNKVLEEHLKRRENFVNSRKTNLLGSHMGSHMGKHMGNRNRNGNTKEINKGGMGGFKKPTVEEVKAYCQELKNTIDPAKWLDYYESNGWKVGRNPMKDWKAAVRTWEKNNFEKQGSPILKSQVREDHALDKIKQWEKESHAQTK
jgi:hypothetical protein